MYSSEYSHSYLKKLLAHDVQAVWYTLIDLNLHQLRQTCTLPVSLFKLTMKAMDNIPVVP